MYNCLTLLLFRFVIGLLVAAPDELTTLYTRALQQHLVGIQTASIWLIGCEDMELPRKIDSHRLTPLEEVSREQRKAGGALVVKLLPLKLAQGDLIVTLADYEYRAVNNLVFTGTEEFYYRYDSKGKQYHLVRRKSNGF